MSKRKKAKPRESESLIWKMTARVDPSAFPGVDPRDVGRQAIELYSKTGVETPGVQLIGHWRNPTNRNPLHKNWKTSRDRGQSLGGFYRTIIERTGADPRQITFDYQTNAQLERAKRVFEKRSIAAKAGWLTRRKNIELERKRMEGFKRSQAAKKGAITRKKNQAKAARAARKRTKKGNRT
jgi:hypothetical protein